LLRCATRMLTLYRSLNPMARTMVRSRKCRRPGLKERD
jgi:hypothetical protein